VRDAEGLPVPVAAPIACPHCRGIHASGRCPRHNAQYAGPRTTMYGRRWQRVRAAFLREHPLCVEHERKGEYVEATDVDHCVPHRGDQDLFWDSGNWQSLCHACHAAKTAREVNERDS